MCGLTLTERNSELPWNFESGDQDTRELKGIPPRKFNERVRPSLRHLFQCSSRSSNSISSSSSSRSSNNTSNSSSSSSNRSSNSTSSSGGGGGGGGGDGMRNIKD
uniref:Uncharacterized protein n=1 Tax=Vespula pensylvanica TaxID=30213 RepID=A0A834P3N8_VESPE|nr:hypothetical protein H0235_006903 [Vespula pensylvanica]